MKLLIAALLALSFFYSESLGQDKLKAFKFKKGEILDVILLTPAPNSKAGFERYKKTAFPVAFEYSYQPQPGFKVSKLTLGNYSPASLLIGKWESKNKRESFIQDISDRVPDFHEQRREIFTYFGLAYYEIKEDFRFSVSPNKFNVATAFWKSGAGKYSAFVRKWKKEIEEAGGRTIVDLKQGRSQAGYAYNPTTFVITEWKDQADFEKFTSEHPIESYNVVQNVQQYVIK